MAIDSAKEKNVLRVTVTLPSSNQNHLWPDLNMNTYVAARTHECRDTRVDTNVSVYVCVH